ncbi:ABC transporter substrate-binding protein [Aeromicrobium sp.]|uniref:ABC transporter substrate-binding protein n=1 Tax=Aeromicrobium sp. TaxID=1871063 RepID=UPI004033E054
MRRRPSRFRTLAALAALTTCVGVLAGCGSGSATDEDGNLRLTLAVGAPSLQVANAPYSLYAGKTVWKEAGLNVSTEFTQGAVQSAQLISAGKADASFVGVSAALAIAAKSPKVKIVAITSGNVWKLAVPRDSPVQTVGDLKGSTIGVKALSTAAYLYVRAALDAAGVDPDDDVEWLPTGTGAQEANAVDSGTVDALATYVGPYEISDGLSEKGLRLVPTVLDDLDGSGAIIVNTDTLTEHRDAVVQLLRGMSKVGVVAAEDPEAIVRSTWDEDPAIKPRGVSDDEAMSITLGQVRAYWDLVLDQGPEDIYGVLSEDTLADAIRFHLDTGIVEDEVGPDVVDFGPAREADEYDKAAWAEQVRADAR